MNREDGADPSALRMTLIRVPKPPPYETLTGPLLHESCSSRMRGRSTRWPAIRRPESGPGARRAHVPRRPVARIGRSSVHADVGGPATLHVEALPYTTWHPDEDAWQDVASLVCAGSRTFQHPVERRSPRTTAGSACAMPATSRSTCEAWHSSGVREPAFRPAPLECRRRGAAARVRDHAIRHPPARTAAQLLALSRPGLADDRARCAVALPRLGRRPVLGGDPPAADARGLHVLLHRDVPDAVVRRRGESRSEFALVLFIGLLLHGLLAEVMTRAPTLDRRQPEPGEEGRVPARPAAGREPRQHAVPFRDRARDLARRSTSLSRARRRSRRCGCR